VGMSIPPIILIDGRPAPGHGQECGTESALWAVEPMARGVSVIATVFLCMGGRVVTIDGLVVGVPALGTLEDAASQLIIWGFAVKNAKKRPKPTKFFSMTTLSTNNFTR
jgi:hypothetical protein